MIKIIEFKIEDHGIEVITIMEIEPTYTKNMKFTGPTQHCFDRVIRSVAKGNFIEITEVKNGR